MKTKFLARVALVPGLRSVVRTLSDRRGVTALEYGLLAALIAVILIASMQAFSAGLGGVFTRITARLAGMG